MLQKTFTIDFLTKKTKVNEGEVPQYYIENSHPAIVEPEIYELVQGEILRRQKLDKHPVRSNPFSCKIVCGECGGYFGSKTWHSKSKHRKVIWQCNEKYRSAATDSDTVSMTSKGEQNEQRKRAQCNTPHLEERAIQAAFVDAVNRLIDDKEELVERYKAALAETFDTSGLDKDIADLKEECSVVVELVNRCVAENAKHGQDQTDYEERYTGLVKRYEAAKAKLDTLMDKKAELTSKSIKAQHFIDKLKSLSETTDRVVTAFDENMWRALVETLTVNSNGTMLFSFKDISIIMASME